MDNTKFVVLLFKMLAISLLYPLLRYLESMAIFPMINEVTTFNNIVVITRVITLALPSILLWFVAEKFVGKLIPAGATVTSLGDVYPLAMLVIACVLVALTFGDFMDVLLRFYFSMKGITITFTSELITGIIRTVINIIIAVILFIKSRQLISRQ